MLLSSLIGALNPIETNVDRHQCEMQECLDRNPCVQMMSYMGADDMLKEFHCAHMTSGRLAYSFRGGYGLLFVDWGRDGFGPY